jgi:putative DNA primase/helicase
MSLAEYEATKSAFEVAQSRSLKLNSQTESADLDRLAVLSPLEYARERTSMARKLGIAVSFLDKEIEQRQRVSYPVAAHGSGQPLALLNIEPAEEPANGENLLAHMVSTLKRFVVLPPHAALAIALWVIRSHADDCFDTNPRLALLSPEKRCGKTTLLELIAKLVNRALPTSNVTASVIFRTIEAAHPTLLIDEMDSFSEAHEELRGILNSGHRRETARVIRTVGDDHEPRVFSTWCPMVLAAIGRLPCTIEDRSVIVPMRRRAPHESIERLRWHSKAGQAIDAELRTLARGVARWVIDNRPLLRQCEPAVPETLNDRAADNWSPLLTIAECIGQEWGEKARKAAVVLSGNSETDTASEGVRLLGDIRELFHEKGCDRFGSEQLCDYLVDLEERPWAQWRHGKPVTPHQLAKLLRPYKVISRSIRVGERTGKGYHLDCFADAFDRYLTPFDDSLPSGGNAVSKGNSVTTGFTTSDSSLFETVTAYSCDVSKNGTNAALGASCDGVTVPNPAFAEEEEILEGETCL